MEIVSVLVYKQQTLAKFCTLLRISDTLAEFVPGALA